jgi:hypothetical protein
MQMTLFSHPIIKSRAPYHEIGPDNGFTQVTNYLDDPYIFLYGVELEVYLLVSFQFQEPTQIQPCLLR